MRVCKFRQFVAIGNLISLLVPNIYLFRMHVRFDKYGFYLKVECVMLAPPYTRTKPYSICGFHKQCRKMQFCSQPIEGSKHYTTDLNHHHCTSSVASVTSVGIIKRRKCGIRELDTELSSKNVLFERWDHI